MSSSVAPDATQLPAKPGTACLGCRRRKLKCSREQEGCTNCTKADLPCVYPVPETGVKRKRGPYKKDKPPRERHLEHLVKYLEPRAVAGGSGSVEEGHEATPNSHSRVAVALDQIPFLSNNQGRTTTNSESLVKDALIALTKSSASDRESTTESGACPEAAGNVPLGGSGDLHPAAGRIFEYWSIFTYRVDPLTKVLHKPTFIKKLFAAVSSPHSIDAGTETLLFSIYYVAVSTCTAKEARRRFGEGRDVLLKRYGRVIEDALANNYSVPALEAVQAVVLYIIGVRRQDDGTSVSTLFGLAVRMAQMVGLNEDPGTRYGPLQAELRRRLWWHICGLESRTAEEGGIRSTSIMEETSVQFPSNLNDIDLDPRGAEQPVSRDGVTEITFVRLRWDVMRTVRRIWRAKKRKGSDGQPRSIEAIVAEQRDIYESTRTKLGQEYSRHMHKSRPYDWMCLRFLEGMLIKTKLIIDYPFGQVPRSDMSDEERFPLLQSSVAVISTTHLLALDRRVEDWHWFFRDYVQWHSLAIVVAELGRSTNKQFTASAWAVLDPILADWDRMYGTKKDEPAWHHVNTLITRAKQKRHQAEKTHPPSTTVGTAHRTANTHSSLPVNDTFDPAIYHPNQPAVNSQALGNTGQPWMHTTNSAVSPQPQQAPAPHSLDGGGAVHSQHSCAPTAFDFTTDFGSFDGFDQIDFGAFDAVFGGTGWEFPSPLADMGGMGMAYDPSLQAPV